jgi:hypothetical protein
MPISVRARDGVSIIELKGEFTIGNAGMGQPLDTRGRRLSELGLTLHRLLEDGERRIVLDLRGLNHLDSAGVGELVFCKKRTAESGRGMLEMLSLGRIFEMFDDESAALASFDA